LPIEAAFRAAWMNDPAQSAPIHGEIDAFCARAPQKFTVTPLDGAQLYPRVRAAYAIVATGEGALYANVILRKAALAPPQ
jgi:L-fucose mutarotase